MQNNTENQVYAGFFVRLIAYLVDLLIVGIGKLVLQAPFGILQLFFPNNFFVRDLIFQYSIADMVLYALGVTYFVLLTYQGGATVGKMLLNIQVVSTEDRKLTFMEVLYRETIGRFLCGLLLSAGYLLVIFHKEKRGIHDLLSDTKVVYHFKKKVVVEVPITVQQVRKPVVLTPGISSVHPNNYTAASYMPAVEEPVVQPEVIEEEQKEEAVVTEAVTEEIVVEEPAIDASIPDATAEE